MAISTGFIQAYNSLELSSGDLAVYFTFSGDAGLSITNNGNYPTTSGILSSLGNFHSVDGTGNFTGQFLRLANPQNTTGQSWTHIFVLEKSTASGGILFDSFQSGNNGIYSGYLIGLNDNHKLFFEHFDNFGPAVYTSDTILPKKACIAVTRSNNTLSFYFYDFNQEELIADTKVINGNYLLPSTKAFIGSISGAPAHTSYRNYSGFIDDYALIKDAITPNNLRQLFSGFVSSLDYIPGTVTYSTGIEITGYSLYFTGVTGVISSGNTPISSGFDVFGDYFVTYSTVATTGYLSSGSGLMPLTGNVVTTSTGDSVPVTSYNSSFANEFKFNEISFLRKIDIEDTTFCLLYSQNIKGLNKTAVFDRVEGAFELDSVYLDSQIQPYLNGLCQIYTGVGVTGNFYNSGVFPSGAYYLEDFYIKSTGFYTAEDTIIYDNLSGSKLEYYTTGVASGNTETFAINSGSLVFFNGQLLISGYHYNNNAGNFRWISNIYSGATGNLSRFDINYPNNRYTGVVPVVDLFPRNSSMVWLNGTRQRNAIDYIENSSVDLLRSTGVFDVSTETLYADDQTFWE